MFLAAATGAGGSSSMIIILLLFFVLMWFFMIRPEKKKQKKIEAMRSALSVGDEIVTIGGIMGTIVMCRRYFYVCKQEQIKKRHRYRNDHCNSADCFNVRRIRAAR